MQGKLYVVMWSDSQVIILHDFILDHIPLLVSSHPTTSLIKKNVRRDFSNRLLTSWLVSNCLHSEAIPMLQTTASFRT